MVMIRGSVGDWLVGGWNHHWPLDSALIMVYTGIKLRHTESRREREGKHQHFFRAFQAKERIGYFVDAVVKIWGEL